MRHRIVFAILLGAATISSVAAQKKVITNADLDGYKQQRLSAERDYRENYERLGLPSPEEINSRLAKSQAESMELSAKLRAERMERERIQAGLQANAELADAYYRAAEPRTAAETSDGDYFWSYGWVNGRRQRIPVRRRQGQLQQPGYFAGGQFWSTAPRTPSRPLFVHVRP